MILIVDQDPLSAPSLARLLRYNGHAAEVVPAATEALALLPTRKPEAIILDLNLPHISGLQLIEAIRAGPSYADVPIIVYTAEYGQEKARAAMAAGAVDVIVKGTVGTQSLLARIERHLKDHNPQP
jgi:DNA-binding response OmpR family regulator